MRRNVQAAVLSLAAGWLIGSSPVRAQLIPPPMAKGIQIEYREPTNPAHRSIYDRLRKRQVLEQYKEFMSPLQLKTPLQVVTRGCNGTINAWFNGSATITFCYEYIAFLEGLVASAAALPGFRREDALVGDFVQTLLHETSHALFALLDIPVFGREEDAADALAEFVLLRLGNSTARRALTGTAFTFRAWEARRTGPRSLEDYSDEHGTNGQRFYNALCIAYGHDLVEGTQVFSDFIENNLLPPERRGHCAQEYRHAKNSFIRLILPYVDQALMTKVQGTEWIRSEDGTDVLPPTSPGGLGGPPGPGSPGGGPGNPGAGPSPGPGNPGPGGLGNPGPRPNTPGPGNPRPR
jgi:hypothetical protein